MGTNEFVYHVVNGAFFHKPTKSVMSRNVVVGLVGEEGVRKIKREHTSLDTVRKLRKRGWRKVDLS